MSATCLINVITCHINGTSLLAVTSPCKNHTGWPFWCPYRNVDFSADNLHRTTNSRKPQVKIRLAFHFVERNNVLLILMVCCVSSNISNTLDNVSLGYPNTKKRVKNTMRSGVFLTKFEVFG